MGTIVAVLPKAMAVPDRDARDGRDPMPWTSPLTAPDGVGWAARMFASLPGASLYARFPMSANGRFAPGTDSATVRVIIATIHVCRIAFDSNGAVKLSTRWRIAAGVFWCQPPQSWYVRSGAHRPLRSVEPGKIVVFSAQ